MLSNVIVVCVRLLYLATKNKIMNVKIFLYSCYIEGFVQEKRN